MEPTCPETSFRLDETSYKVVRFYQRRIPSRVIETGLTLEEAQEHCNDPETSSRTCTDPELVAHTETHGDWFDGYTEE
jgi:hypothetical protein